MAQADSNAAILAVGDLLKRGEDELAPDKGVVPVDEMAIGGYIAIVRDKEPGSGGGDLFGLFDIIEGGLEKAGRVAVHFP